MSFLTAMNSKNALTFNGALTNSSSGTHCLDYFSNAGNYRGRSEEVIDLSLRKIYGEDSSLALKMMFYNRMITRDVVDENNTKLGVHRGQGQKDEFIKAMAWLEKNHKKTFKANIHLIPVVGCWKDLWYDSPVTKYFHYFNTEYVYPLIQRGLQSKSQRGLIAKYLPRIRSASKVFSERHKRRNQFARGLCSYLGWSEKDYRQFKSSPENTAHLWQRQMCNNEWDKINFDTICGKALNSLINSRGKDKLTTIERHGLEANLEKWVLSKNTVKFTGYPFELMNSAKQAKSKVQEIVINKQFDGLLELAKKQIPVELLNKGVFCALDTSHSMTGFDYYVNNENTKSLNYTPYDICVSLGIYFSSLIAGSFKDHVIMFDSVSRLLKLSGTFCDKVKQIQKASTAWGGTNFQSVIDEIVRVRKQRPNIPVSEYPRVLLVVSDMEFNSSDVGNEQTNYELAVNKLQSVGLPPMTFIWWNVDGREGNVPSTIDNPGTVLVSGLDGAIVTTLLGTVDKTVVDKNSQEVRKLNPQEVMVEALNQPLLNNLVVVD